MKMTAECPAMEKELLSTGYVETTPSVEENGAKDVFRLLKENFYDPERIRQMHTIQETIKTSGDVYTTLVPKHGAGSNEQLTSTTLCDLGLHVQQEEAGFRIVGMRNDSSVLFSEIMTGDLIVGANNVNVSNLKPGSHLRASTTHWFKDLVTGNKGTPATLSVERKGCVKKVSLKLSSLRRYAELSETGRDDIRAVHIDKFAANTYDDICKALRSCDPCKLRGVIVDLRGNGGGTLESAVDVSSLFIEGPEKEIMNEIRREGFKSHKTNKAALFGDIAVGMLVDEQSASASEILVGSLKHHRHGLVVGQKTFGKASVQQGFDIPTISDKRVKITISHWMTPDGQYVHGKGFRPDIYVGDVRLSLKGKIDEAMETAVEELARELPKRNFDKKRYRSMK